MKTRKIMTSLKMDERGKSSKKRHMKISTHQTYKMLQLTASSETKTKLIKKTPPSKMAAQKNN